MFTWLVGLLALVANVPLWRAQAVGDLQATDYDFFLPLFLRFTFCRTSVFWLQFHLADLINAWSRRTRGLPPAPKTEEEKQ